MSIKSFKDLLVYQKSADLHIEIDTLTLSFPKYELYELGSQLRRSSNSVPAQIAEGWNNKHLTIYLECLNRAIGELQETQHHIFISYRKSYITKNQYNQLNNRYDECAKMLWGIIKSLNNYRF